MIDETKSLKQRIFDSLSKFDVSVSYNESIHSSFPRIVYFLVSNYSRRLSNQKTIQHISYQVSFYDIQPHDVETSEVLLKFQMQLENDGMLTTNWQEVSVVKEDIEETVYHYYLEVSV